VPLSQGDTVDACNSVRSALAMLKRVEEMNAERLAGEDYPDLRIGIGIHTGTLTSGSVGSSIARILGNWRDRQSGIPAGEP